MEEEEEEEELCRRARAGYDMIRCSVLGGFLGWNPDDGDDSTNNKVKLEEWKVKKKINKKSLRPKTEKRPKC